MPKYSSTANGLAALGRNGDSMLMHVNPQEVAGLAALFGTEPTVNPETGLPEAFGWGSMLSSVLGSVAEMDVGAEVADWLAEQDWLKNSVLDADTLGTIGGGLAGAGLGAARGAATEAATGGNAGYGAMGGAFSGAMSGGYGGMERQALLGAPDMTPAEQKMDDLFYEGTDTPALQRSFTPQESPGFWKTNFGSMGGLKNFASEHGSVPMLAGSVGSAFSAMSEDQKLRKQQEAQKLALLKRAGIDPSRMMYSYSFSTPSFSGGGAVGYAGEYGVPVQAYIPQHAIDSIKKEGGIGALGMARGGYINTNEFDPDNAHPLSMVDKAKPYPAAAPQRHEVVEGYAEGGYAGDDEPEDSGFVEGDGDGMSDDVDALLEGEEEIRVADGEVIIPKAIVDMFGVEALDNMLKRVRMAAYGTPHQVKQDAGKEVVLDMLE